MVALAVPAVALAYDNAYGGYNICGSNCYIQSDPGHTYRTNYGGAGLGSTYLACQLFNRDGVSYVQHGYGGCSVYYGGGQYVTGRVYNQSGYTDVVAGHAYT